MKQFLTFDFNGWFDHILNQNGEARALGFRSCLYEHQGRWLVGAQALAAARYESSPATIDVIDALAYAAGHGQLSLEQGKISPLPSALWNLIETENRTADHPIHLALIVPDDKIFGNPKVIEGKTRLETLYDSFYQARPRSVMRSKIEFIWRSVAVLQAALDEDEERLKGQVGKVLVVSVNQMIFWKVLELDHWPRNDSSDSSIRIVRTPVNESSNYSDMGKHSWMKDLLKEAEILNSVDSEKLHQWTRYMEILVTNASSNTLDQFDIDENAIEHRTWPIVKGERVLWRAAAPIEISENYARVSLLKKLKEIIKIVIHQLNQKKEKLLAVIIENPVDDEMFDHLWPVHRQLSENIQIHYVSGAATAKAAGQLAKILAESNHPHSPAWLDSVPEIQLEVREKLNDGHEGSKLEWRAVVSGNEVVPAGEIYYTQPDKHERRRITLAPGIEFAHLHLRRRSDHNAWDHRYTQHAIEPSDHVRVVEPLARVRPLSEVARIEIIEHRQNDEIEALAGSTGGIKWDDLTDKRPPALSSIPELFIFPASKEGWKNLKPILEKIKEAGELGADPSLRISLRNKMYERTQKQWRSREFPLGSDGQPPRTSNGRDYVASEPLLFPLDWVRQLPRTSNGKDYIAEQRLLRNAIRILVKDLKYCVNNQVTMPDGEANRLHLGLTWLFSGCPEEVTKILLDAIINPDGKAGTTLHIKKKVLSAWSIYQGVGRTVKSAESLRIIYDTLIERWEKNGGQKQDKFLLSAVSHPLARRRLVREILYEDQKRFERVKRFLCQQLDNIIAGKHDSKAGIKPSLELRYVIMGFRGLCQIRYKNPEWFPVDGSGECGAKRTYQKLMQLKNIRWLRNKDFEQKLLELSAPYLIGEGEDPTMPGGF